jgi:hypothetical protein
MVIERKVVSDDGLERTVFKFSFFFQYDPHVYLSEVVNEVRESKRHRKWSGKIEWRYNDRSKKNVPEIPSGMVDGVLKEIRDMIVYRENPWSPLLRMTR